MESLAYELSKPALNVLAAANAIEKAQPAGFVLCGPQSPDDQDLLDLGRT